MGARNPGPSATAAAAKLAGEAGLELVEIDGTGKGGRITVDDVRAAEAGLGDGPPADLPGRGKRIWDEVRSYLEDHALWRPVYAKLLERYVRNLLQAEDMRREAAGRPVVLGSQGQPVANPALKIGRDAELDAHKYAEALMLTPEALKRHLRGSEPPDEESTPLGF